MKVISRGIAVLALSLPVMAASAKRDVSLINGGPDVSAKSAIVIDSASGKILWQKNSDEPRFPASTTKIMTALLLIEHCRPYEVITAPSDVTNVKEASMHLKPHEKLAMRDLLYALMLRSANDGCYAVAIRLAGSVPAFSRMMNERAKELGCTHTHFDNPNGLNDPQHTVSAHDLAIIAREAMRYPLFREVVRTQKIEIQRSINQGDRVMVNHDGYLRKDPTADGIKTGWTRPAGHCFVGSATRKGMRFITVVMASDHWQLDNQNLLDWAYQNFTKVAPIAAGDPVGTVKVENGSLPEIPVEAKTEAYALARVGQNDVSEQYLDVHSVKAPVEKGAVVGKLVLVDSDGFEQQVPVVAGDSVELAPTVAIVQASTSPKGSAVFFGSALFLGAYWMRGRTKKVKVSGRRTAATERAEQDSRQPAIVGETQSVE